MKNHCSLTELVSQYDLVNSSMEGKICVCEHLTDISMHCCHKDRSVQFPILCHFLRKNTQDLKLYG